MPSEKTSRPANAKQQMPNPMAQRNPTRGSSYAGLLILPTVSAPSRLRWVFSRCTSA